MGEIRRRKKRDRKGEGGRRVVEEREKGCGIECLYLFFFKQKTAYEVLRSLVGSEMCVRDRCGRRR